VDLLEMKSYSEIDLDETPIVVLGCGHFFTAETLDGHMGMAEVYLQDESGEFIGLRDVSAVLSRSIPRCPDCQCAVRQYANQRFNRVVNRAVIDEMSKRFLVNGKAELGDLEQQLATLEHSLEDTRSEIIQSVRPAGADFAGEPTPAKQLKITQQLKERYEQCKKLKRAIQTFRKKVADKHQPAQKLHEATVHAHRRELADHLMTNLTFADAVPRDQRVTMGGRAAQLKAEYISLFDSFSIAQSLKISTPGAAIKLPGGAPDQLAKPFFQDCKKVVDDCSVENLPKLGVEACLYYATIARFYHSFCITTKISVAKASEFVKTAREMLEKARESCAQPFQSAKVLLGAVDNAIKLLGKEWYEEVTAQEVAAIKAAMVSGRDGIATHSGHWYNCENGHPVSSPEIGSPYSCVVHLNNRISLQSGSVACLWSWLVVQNAEPLSAARITVQFVESVVRRIWKTDKIDNSCQPIPNFTTCQLKTWGLSSTAKRERPKLRVDFACRPRLSATLGDSHDYFLPGGLSLRFSALCITG
jgi:hypothetical protein